MIAHVQEAEMFVPVALKNKKNKSFKFKQKRKKKIEKITCGL